MKTNLVRIFCFIAFLLPAHLFAQRVVPADFDGDGLSEFVLINSSGNVLNWSAVTHDGSAQRSLGDFGRLGFHISLGDWLGAGIPQPATVTKSGSKVVWRIFSQGASTLAEFGELGDTAVAGGDFFGDGIVDAAVYTVSGRALSWRIHPSLFTDSTATTTDFSFGRVSNKIFFANLSGANDRVAALINKGNGRVLIRYFNPKTMRGTRVAFKGKIPSSQLRRAPLPLRNARGRDDLLFYAASGSSTRFTLFTGAKKRTKTFRIKARGEVLVGNFSAEPGEEIAVQSDDGFTVFNPIKRVTKKVVTPSGIAVDEVNMNAIADTESPPPIDNTPPSQEPPLAGLRSVCASTSAIGSSEMLIKSEISDHIPGVDPRATGYTLVCARVCPRNQSRADFFYADGSYAGSVAKYGTFSGNGQPRLYGAVGEAPQHFASDISARARSIGNGKLYMQISSARSGNGTECKEFNPTGRNGGLY